MAETAAAASVKENSTNLDQASGAAEGLGVVGEGSGRFGQTSKFLQRKNY